MKTFDGIGLNAPSRYILITYTVFMVYEIFSQLGSILRGNM